MSLNAQHLHQCLHNKLIINASCNAPFHWDLLLIIQLINVLHPAQVDTLLIIGQDNANQTAQIGLQILEKFLKHAQHYVNLELMPIRQLINALENALIIIGLINLQGIAFSFAHSVTSLIIQHQNVCRNVQVHIHMLIR